MGRVLASCVAVVVGCGLAFACGSEGDEFTPSKKPDSGSGGSSGGTAGSGGASGSAGSTDAPTGGAAGGDSGPDVVCNDDDGDTFTTCDGDCDDTDPTSFPGGAEICGDSADNDCANGADDGCGGLGTFVSELTGDDALNPGTQALPVKTIAKGIANALTIQATTQAPIDVYVAEGTYKEKVTLEENVNVLGGFSCAAQPCTWTRDPATYVSTIENQDFEGVLADNSITRQTRLDGFLVQGLSGAPPSIGAIGVTLAGGTPTIANNTIVAGDSSSPSGASGRSIGLLLFGPSNDVKGARIEANDITAGQSANDVASGVYFDGGGKPGFNYAEVVSNQISGGTGKHAQGITSWSSGVGTLFQNNDIQAGDAAGGAWGIGIGGKALIDANRINADSTKPAKCGQLNFCGGIQSISGTLTITNNIVFGTNSPQSAAVLLGEFEVPVGAVTLNSNYLDGAGSSSGGSLSAALALQHGNCCGVVAIVGRVANNVLAGGSASARYGVYELKVGGKAAHPELLMNNDFFVPNQTASDGYYQHADQFGVITKAVTLADVVALSTKLPLVSGNIEGDPMFDTTFHLQTGSPAINAATATDLPAQDFEGEARPKGIAGDIGPDEAE